MRTKIAYIRVSSARFRTAGRKGAHLVNACRRRRARLRPGEEQRRSLSRRQERRPREGGWAPAGEREKEVGPASGNQYLRAEIISIKNTFFRKKKPTEIAT